MKLEEALGRSVDDSEVEVYVEEDEEEEEVNRWQRARQDARAPLESDTTGSTVSFRSRNQYLHNCFGARCCEEFHSRLNTSCRVPAIYIGMPVRSLCVAVLAGRAAGRAAAGRSAAGRSAAGRPAGRKSGRGTKTTIVRRVGEGEMLGHEVHSSQGQRGVGM